MSSPEIQETAAPAEDLASRIETALLGPELSEDDVARAFRNVQQLGIAAVILRPCDVDSAVRWSRGPSLRLGAVVDWPHGFSATAAKLYAARDLLRRGVQQMETVMNTGKLISRQFQFLEMELLQMAESCHQSGAELSIHLQSEYLNEELKILACRIARRAGADYLGTNQPGDLALLQSHARERLKIKCSAPTADLDQVLAFRQAGCARIQLSDPAPVLEAWKARQASSPESPAAGGHLPLPSP